MGPITDYIQDDFKSFERSTESSLVSFKCKQDPQPRAPAPLDEPNDMTIVDRLVIPMSL